MLLNLFRRKPMFGDGVIDLVLSPRDETDEECGITGGYTFYIYPAGTRDYAGYISLRLGESPALYYLGHIGYRVEEKYRGDHFALRACRLLYPLAARLSMESLVITNDPDNLASRRTCEELGCVLERVADVPPAYRYYCSGSKRKCRYIWLLKKEEGPAEGRPLTGAGLGDGAEPTGDQTAL